jgi:hypothetical protein
MKTQNLQDLLANITNIKNVNEGYQINKVAMASNEQAIIEFLDFCSPAGYIGFLLSMQQSFLQTNAKKGNEGHDQDYVEECVFDFKNLIEFISKLQDPYEFTERKNTAA